jgi:hypothetical protein
MPKTPFSCDAIETMWATLTELDQPEAIKVATRFQTKQPAAMMYLMAMDDCIEDPSRKGQMLELGMLIFSLFDEAYPKMVAVTPEELDALDDANMDKMDDPNVFAARLDSYNQGDLLGFLIELLAPEAPESSEQKAADMGLQMLSLKTVLDAFDR